MKVQWRLYVDGAEHSSGVADLSTGGITVECSRHGHVVIIIEQLEGGA
jgi:hypothetical protein